ncbi:TetR/AcrR family transcriptional regulator [Actinokineospora sp. NBRC 105648]|uniref:TetR/AcrR family transcriptional regulator n=1 Tax=Actinokineospora sp. NBRC 105648 TaxID=3032206 RepID=UPI0024A12965|nr:TetR/AcrR family transcriptional regulator [Actinokineospora sp. NBRC 105648]GLZ37289.1 HTH-type transcriptional regulator PksA [Actinokineospora sp. NBRC 105648]
MPKQVDHAQRRRTIAEALWRIVVERGIEAVSLRHVAEEAGVSMGMVQHYFTGKDELLLFALRAMTERVGSRIGTALRDADPADSRAQVRAMFVETLPLDDERRLEALVGCVFLIRATVDPATAEHLRTGWFAGEAYFTGMLDAAGLPDAALRCTLMLSVVQGLTLHALAGHLSPERTLHALDAELDRVFGPKGR